MLRSKCEYHYATFAQTRFGQSYLTTHLALTKKPTRSQYVLFGVARYDSDAGISRFESGTVDEVGIQRTRNAAGDGVRVIDIDRDN